MRLLFILLFIMSANNAEARNIFLNGSDISSARSQELENVKIYISDKGDIFISAPQYQVFEEKTYVPLQSRSSITHQIDREDEHPNNLPSAVEMVPGAAGATSSTLENPASDITQEQQ